MHAADINYSTLGSLAHKTTGSTARTLFYSVDHPIFQTRWTTAFPFILLPRINAKLGLRVIGEDVK